MLTTTQRPSDWHDPNQWAVYSHSLPDGAPLWVGYCRASDVLFAPDARDSAAWKALVSSVPALVLHVHSLHPGGNQAMRAAFHLIRAVRPPVNGKEPPRAPGNSRRVICIDTGEIFDNAADACRKHGIHKSQMSVYLQRKDGRKLRGLNFEYC